MITKEDVLERVASIDYWRPALTNTTICCLRFKNGFTQIGWCSCAKGSGFDIEKGKEIALARAIENSYCYLAWEKANEQL